MTKELAVEAVIGELVSKGNSLITGKIQGIFANLASRPGRSFVFGYINQSLAAKFPMHKNRVFFRGIREVAIRYQGNLKRMSGKSVARD